METNTALVVGLVVMVLSLPALISAWTDRRRPYIGTLLLFAGCAMVVWAFRTAPGGYTLQQVPEVVYTVIGDMVR